MRLGLSISNFTWSPDQQLLGDTFGLMVERAERAGLYSLWVPDHFFQIPWIGPPAGIEEEHQGLGIPLPPLAERIARLEETLQIAHRMWSGDEKPYEGKYYHLARPLNSPQAIQKPHPPILVGGHGEQKTLRL